MWLSAKVSDDAGADSLKFHCYVANLGLPKIPEDVVHKSIFPLMTFAGAG